MAAYVAYYRVSTDRQGVSRLGLDTQRQAVARYIGTGELIAEFTEIESGKKHTNRPQLLAAFARCRKHRATLVIASLDRLKQTLGKSKGNAAEDGPTPAGKRRAVGKRSDPNYTPTTFFVRKETKRKAAQMLLEDVNSKTDLSDLVEELLAKWVAEHSNA